MAIPTWWSSGLVVPLCTVLAGCVVTQTSYDQLQTSYQQSQANNERLRSENASLQAQLGQPPQQSIYTVAADLLFAPGVFDITANGRAALNDIASKLKMLRNSKIVVNGYTDDQKPGDSLRKQDIKTNLDLSSRRAQAVANYLVAQGVSANISAKGRGDTRPVASNGTAAGRAQNRRIEIAVEGFGS
jgi:flagellar motor protein MotB